MVFSLNFTLCFQKLAKSESPDRVYAIFTAIYKLTDGAEADTGKGMT
jgi:hypothetical protein